MTDTLLHAYTPLIVWTGLGMVLVQFMPASLPRWLGRGLYWVGVPVQIFTLSRQTQFPTSISLGPAIALFGLITGLVSATLMLWQLERSPTTAPPPPPPVLNPDAPLPPVPDPADPTINPWLVSARRGSLVLASMLGNTGFVGLAVVPNFITEPYLGWIVVYSISQNVVGTYGMGVLLASFYGRSNAQVSGLTLLRDILTVPSLWAFGIGLASRSIPFPEVIETGLHGSLSIVIPAALVLMGIRLRQIQGWQGLKLGIFPALTKMLVLPAMVGLLMTVLHLPSDARLAMVLMAGMPTAFAGLILAEEYELDYEVIASSIVVSTLMLFITTPCWLFVFGSLP